MSKGFSVFNFAEPENLKKQQVPPRKIDSSDQIIAWETQDSRSRNNFPQQLLQSVFDSPAGSSALDIWQEFIEGDGFVNSELDDVIINNDGEKMSDLHRQLSADMAYLWGCAVHVSYNIKGEKTELRHLPFESTRLGLIDHHGKVKDIKYNPYFGIPQDKNTADTKCYYTYNPNPEHVKKEIANHAVLKSKGKVKYDYPGQVLWFSIERPLARVYPQPFYYSSVKWFKIDAEIQNFHERNISNNFLLSVLINMYGNPNQPAGQEFEDENGDKKDQGETIGEVFNKHLKEQLSGAKNGGSALINWYLQEQEKADIQAFPTNANDSLFTVLQNLTTDQICIGTKVPPILLSIKTAGKLGDSSEIINAVMVMQARVNRQQRALTTQYTELMKDFKRAPQYADWTIKNINPFNILPAWALSVLTPSEKRKYISENFPIDIDTEIEFNSGGLTPINSTDGAGEIMRKMTGKEFQQMQRIVRKYNKGEISYEQAQMLLMESYKFSEDQAELFLIKEE